jgi:hypothetical protein
MSDLETIATQKAEAAIAKRISALPLKIQAIQRELTAKGLLQSGAMLKGVLAACCSSLEAQATTVREEYEWAVSQALVVSQSWVEQLAAVASGSLDAFHEPVRGHLERACKLAGQPQLFDRLYAEFQSCDNAARSGIGLSLRAKFAERRRGIIRALPVMLQRLISRIFTGSGA